MLGNFRLEQLIRWCYTCNALAFHNAQKEFILGVTKVAVCALLKANLALDADPKVVKLVAKEKDLNTLALCLSK